MIRLRLGITVSIVAILLSGVTIGLLRANDAQRAPTPHVTSPLAPQPPSTRTAPRGSVASTSEQTGHDADHDVDERTRQLVLSTAAQFLRGWTTTDPTRRRELLTSTATTRLATPLLSIPKHRIPAHAPAGLRLTAISLFAATVTGINPDVTLVLVADPTQTPVWRVDDITPTH